MQKSLLCFLLFSLSLCAMDVEVSKQDGILHFWLGPIDHEGKWSDYYANKWFRNDPEFDETVELLFSRDVQNAALGKYNHWKESAKGRLALVILLDQFPRNIYRGTPQAFAYDALALQLSLEGIELHQDEALHPIERKFLYMPLMHAEEKQIQQKSVELFQTLLANTPDKQKEHFERTLRFAKVHLQIIEEFGRFPHRNAILGRSSTPYEREYLNESQENFGQQKSS